MQVLAREDMDGHLTTDSWRHRFEQTLWLAFAIVLATHTRADPDLWGNLRFGLDVLERGIFIADSYAFTTDIPWVNHEWLSEVVMALAWRAGGTPGLVALKLLLAALTWLPISRLFARHAPRLQALAPLLVVAALSTWGNNLRPQSFSCAAFAGLLWLLDRGSVRPASLALVPLLFVLWVNLHGGWLVGGLTLATWATTRLFTAPDAIGRLLPLAVGCASLLATLVNPHGAAMWTFLFDTVAFGRADIVDWQPIHRAGIAAVITWLAAAVVTTLALVRPTRPDASWTAVLVVLAIAGARVNRITAFFALAVVAIALPHVVSARASRRGAPMPRAQALIGIAVVLLAGAGMTWWNARCIRMDAPWLPDIVTTRGMTTLPPGRMLPFFSWGHMVIWHRGGELLVSTDGRRETVYSEAVRARHVAMYEGRAEAEAYPEALGVDYVWLPRRFVVVERLKARGWWAIAEGDRASLLVRPGLALPALPVSASTDEEGAIRCFPGP